MVRLNSNIFYQSSVRTIFKNFNILDEPGKPGTPKIKDYDANFVELEWGRPLSDGGSPITGYIIERRDKYSPVWEKCAEVDGDVNTGKVNDLIEGNSYEFRVVAVNKAGLSEPSDATKPHIARPKNSKFLKLTSHTIPRDTTLSD